MRPSETRAEVAARLATVRDRPRIVLMRHGRPDLAIPHRLSPRDWPILIDAYDRAGICAGSPPPGRVASIASECNLVVCSHLPRSMESALVLACRSTPVCDDLFREVALPHALWALPRLHPYLWGMVFRSLWMLGFSRHGESRKAARQRAGEVAGRLVAWTEACGSVLLVGHGMLNQLIAGNLRELGWHGPRLPGISYWGFGEYTRP